MEEIKNQSNSTFPDDLIESDSFCKNLRELYDIE